MTSPTNPSNPGPLGSPSQPAQPAKEGDHEGGKGVASALGLVFPVDMGVWQEARRLVTDKNLRVDDLATCACQDPAIVIELLRVSNAMYFSAGRQPITSTRTAIVRLGSQVVLETFEKMKERPQIVEEDIAHWFELHRSRCKRTSIIGRILAEALSKTVADECQAVGLMMYVGEMLAVLHFGERYVALAEELSRSGINYRLAQDFKFDVERMALNYLRRNGIPEALLFAIDREGGRSKSPEKAIMKPLCAAASELVEGFDANRWEKFAPGKSLPPKSPLRMLSINEGQYLKIYERAAEYLYAARSDDERKKQAAINLAAGVAAGTAPGDAGSAAITIPPAPEPDALQDEIQSLIQSRDTEEDSQGDDDFEAEMDLEAEEIESPRLTSVPPPGGSANFVAATPQNRESLLARNVDFSLDNGGPKKSVARQQSAKAKIEPPKMLSSNATTVLTSMTNILNAAASSEELLSKILAMLIDNGPFKKSALIVVSKDRSKAIVVAARGGNIGNGQKLEINDPLSPLAQCFSKVQSFGNKESKNSPFGSKSFALAPIDADHDTPVALYADCGNDGAISFEARRIFRTVVEILNQKLPTIPGGIPVELN